MGKAKNKGGSHSYSYMPLDRKSNQDFNGQHPDHDENGLINASAVANDKEVGNDSKQTSDTLEMQKTLSGLKMRKRK